jgi:carboxyl-terminal processing protease
LPQAARQGYCCASKSIPTIDDYTDHRANQRQPLMPRTKPAFLLCITVVVCTISLLTAAVPGHAIGDDAGRELKRALKIIHNTQLRLFRDSPADSTDAILRRLDDRTEQLTLERENAEPDTTRVDAMREVLAETMASYNDAYANYITPANLKKYRERRSGNYVGIGLKFRVRENDYPRVIGTLTGGPLELADIQPADKIISAGSKDLKGLRSSEVVSLLKGDEDTTVELTLQRESAPPFKLTAKRQHVDLHYARSEMIAGDIGYIKVSRFGGRTHTRVRKQVRALQQKNASAFVLDLRDNPGGSTRAARDIVSIFSDRDVVYFERYVTGKFRNQPRHGKHLTDKPLALLINGNSMSSSEIVAGAIQAHERGTIVGAPSYGKGLVQQIFDLKEPLGGAIRSTIAVFGRPDQKLIHGSGIVPDYYIETDADFMFRQTGSLNISDKARAFKRKLLEETIRAQRPEEADALIEARDEQLEKALEILRSEIGQQSANG